MCFDEIFFHLLENDDQSPVGADSAQDSRMPAGAVQNPNRTEPPQSSAHIYPNLEEFQFHREETQKRNIFHIGISKLLEYLVQISTF